VTTQALGQRKALDVDWPALTDQWRRDGYIGPIRRILAGEEPYVDSDVLFRRKLDELLVQYGVTGLSEAEVHELALSWRRLDPWPDTVPGLTRLRTRFTVSPLSNGTFATLTAMAKWGGLPWDCIISTDLRRTFKPHRDAYLLAPALLGLEPEEVMLVAAHSNDLRGAQQCGLRTALVPRPQEWGPDKTAGDEPDPSFDYVAKDFEDLARQLGLA
jgi:2-haloacid dehalogenase